MVPDRKKVWTDGRTEWTDGRMTPKIFALDSAVVEVQEMFSSHGGHLTNAKYHHGETL